VPDQLQSNLLKPEVIIEITLRRRWWIIIPIILSLIAGTIVAIKLPREFDAVTTILVEPQSVPQSYVKSIVNEGIESRVKTMTQQILSRTNLEKIVTDFQLLGSGSVDSGRLSAKVSEIRGKINIHVSRNRGQATNFFKISFSSEDPYMAKEITNRLASSFIEENLKIREDKSLGTSNFLDDELEEMRKRLEEKEQKLREYRFAHMGSLPDQLNTNLRTLDRLQMQLTSKENSIREMQDQLETIAAASVGGDSTNKERSLPQMEAQLATLMLKYTEKHPDIIRLKTQIEELKNQLNDPNSPINESNGRQPATLGFNSKIQSLQQEIRFTEADIVQIRTQIAEYERRVEETPTHDQELQAIQRDYNNIQKTYSSLLNRKLEAEIAVNMERKQKGEQFRIIDPAIVPTQPSSPNMKKLFLVVVAAGFGMGAGLVFLLEMITPTFHLPEDIDNYLNLSVLATIPIIKDRRSLMLGRLNMIGTIIAITVVLVMMVTFFSFSIGGVEPTFFARRLP
jgi:polysaccharide chain length determinant protein (PEP-CTERM system associated)